VDVGSDRPEVAALITAVNHLLTRAGPAAKSKETNIFKMYKLKKYKKKTKKNGPQVKQGYSLNLSI